MQKGESIVKFPTKIRQLEDMLQSIGRRCKFWSSRVLAVLTLCASIPLYAQTLSQTAHSTVTLQSLAERIVELEKRVAYDEAQGANIPQQAGDVTTPTTAKAASPSTTTSNTALASRVSALETEVSGVMPQVEQALATFKSHGSASSVKAPFTVVGADGKKVLLTITEQNGGGNLSVNSSDPGNKLVLYYTEDGPAVYMINHGEHAYIARRRATGAFGLYVGSGEKDDVAVDTEGGVGKVHLFTGTKEVGSFSSNSEGAKLLINSPGGGASFSAGISLNDSDAYARVNSKSGYSTLIGAPGGKGMGVRLYDIDGKTATAGMLEDSNGPLVGVLSKGKQIASLAVLGGLGYVGVTGDDNKYLAALTSYPGGGGALQIANPAGQIVSLVDSNPATNTGRAVFTNSGGQPLAKIGAAGVHGDVLLGGPDKALAVWEMMLTGFH